MRRNKPVGRAASGRLLCIDKGTAEKVAGNNGALPRISDMPFDCPVLIVGDGVPAFKVEHVAAALMARGASGYWLVEVQPRPRAMGSGALAETLVGFAGLHVERIASLDDL
ncbi:MAG: hypothetical protein K8F92_01720 [Hyphomicrobium sp.]|uniref:hypothetical protein n=1 Tax=Hyphomicrobium sp. TaxID=82 RepID=UPI001322018C|nr:hypothetical protein [Hyphomicrobium sp.]KAB2942222.1 MAG: hypothetical protein F9K20_06690 [Hyphomicrobium sp.]MBZ0208359.1 hypothetical protein [Hyphomicrobium sp.]MCZ7595643.1 hypothetical protein [Hyphomicrobium sp.]